MLMKRFVLTILALSSAAVWAADSPFEHVQPHEYTDILREASAAYEHQDFARAFELNQRAACAGDKTSQAILGRMYLLGQGTARDDVTGYAWIRLAADFNFADFTSLARKLEDAMTPAQRTAGNAKADAWRRHYGLKATNMSCRGESRRGVYMIDSVICTPQYSGSELLLHRCVDAPVK